MIERDTDMAQRMFSNGFADVVEDAFVRYGESGVWVGEATVADVGLARVIADRKPDHQDRKAAMNVTQIVVGSRELDEEREGRIASAAKATVDKYRRDAVAFPGQYVFQLDVIHDADDLAGGYTGSLVDGTMVRRLPISRVERVVLQTLGFNSPVITNSGEIVEQGVDTLKQGPASQDAFADSMKDHGWLFRNADPSDYKAQPVQPRKRRSPGFRRWNRGI